MKVLFVCRANVGRSQMAEVIFNRLAKGKYFAVSAGTRCQDKEGKSRHGVMLKDIPGAAKVITSLNEIGIDAANNVCNQLTPEMLEEFDKVVVMAEPEHIPDYLSSNSKYVYWEVKDPKEMNLEDTGKIRDQIQGLVEELIKSI